MAPSPSESVPYGRVEDVPSGKGHVKYIGLLLRSLEIVFRSLEIPIVFIRNYTFAFSRNGLLLRSYEILGLLRLNEIVI